MKKVGKCKISPVSSTYLAPVMKERFYSLAAQVSAASEGKKVYFSAASEGEKRKKEVQKQVKKIKS